MIERRPLNNLRLIDDSTPSTSNIEEFEDNISQHPYQYELDSMNIADQILKITIEPKVLLIRFINVFIKRMYFSFLFQLHKQDLFLSTQLTNFKGMKNECCGCSSFMF